MLRYITFGTNTDKIYNSPFIKLLPMNEVSDRVSFSDNLFADICDIFLVTLSNLIIDFFNMLNWSQSATNSIFQID